MKKSALLQFSKEELIYYITHLSMWISSSAPSPESVIFEKRINDNHKKVDALLESNRDEVQRLEAFSKKYDGNVTADNLEEYLRIQKNLSNTQKAIDKCWAENDKYSEALYGK